MPSISRSPSSDSRRLPVPAATRWPLVAGVALVTGIVLIAVSREVFASDAGPLRVLIAGVRASEIVLDVAFLSGIWRLVSPRSKTLVYGSLVVVSLNAVACACFAVAAHMVLDRLGLHDVMRSTTRAAFRDGSLSSLYLSGLWVLGFRYPDLVRSSQQRALEAVRLREQAELVQLRAHLQPHFIRNTLNAVAALVSDEPREARRMLATLGDLLTDSLEAPASTHTLEEEVSWLRRYATILEARYHGALTFVWDISPPARGASIPVLLLQPLVENAALHGALGRDGEGVVTLRAALRDAGGVEIVVSDNGLGFDSTVAGTGTLGLRLVRRRMEIECPRGRLRIESSETGTHVMLELP